MTSKKDQLEISCNELAYDITHWNKQNVGKLRDLLNELNNNINILCGEYYCDYCLTTFGVDICNLPSYTIPEGLELYPIWAMDIDNDCLVGNCDFTVESLDEINEYNANENSE